MGGNWQDHGLEAWIVKSLKPRLEFTGGGLRNRASRRRVCFFFIALSIFLLWVACGKKGPPVSLDRIVPEVIRDLQASVRNERVILQWSFPRENTDGSDLVDLVGFKVLRGYNTLLFLLSPITTTR